MDVGGLGLYLRGRRRCHQEGQDVSEKAIPNRFTGISFSLSEKLWGLDLGPGEELLNSQGEQRERNLLGIFGFRERQLAIKHESQ
jgi:hypothetical protein